MPIYEYRCSACGHQEDFLQKVSDPVLSQCPACGKATFQKQLSAAGFQLKGSGWYATDFKSKKPADKATETKTETKSETKTETKTESKPTPATTD
jgi:putative FmdB family regulatory protein